MAARWTLPSLWGMGEPCPQQFHPQRGRGSGPARQLWPNFPGYGQAPYFYHLVFFIPDAQGREGTGAGWRRQA